jgi:hypothetical protein
MPESAGTFENLQALFKTVYSKGKGKARSKMPKSSPKNKYTKLVEMMKNGKSSI